jgi:hypothetical protein
MKRAKTALPKVAQCIERVKKDHIVPGVSEDQAHLCLETSYAGGNPELILEDPEGFLRCAATTSPGTTLLKDFHWALYNCAHSTTLYRHTEAMVACIKRIEDKAHTVKEVIDGCEKNVESASRAAGANGLAIPLTPPNNLIKNKEADNGSPKQVAPPVDTTPTVTGPVAAPALPTKQDTTSP